jgi:hypothetical protein
MMVVQEMDKETHLQVAVVVPMVLVVMQPRQHQVLAVQVLHHRFLAFL